MDGMFVCGSSVHFCALVTANILLKTAMLAFYPQQMKINLSLEAMFSVLPSDEEKCVIGREN